LGRLGERDAREVLIDAGAELEDEDIIYLTGGLLTGAAMVLPRAEAER
jgi:hypothetical protein